VACGIQVPSVEYAMRTAPIGPSKGMPEIISAADAPLMASTSCGFSWSAPKTVPTTWTSLRKPSGNDGAQRPVDQPVGERRLVGPTLTAEERAGDLARGVHPLFDVDGEREEVGALADLAGSGGGDEHDGVADLYRRRLRRPARRACRFRM
jgi:hypothetical protein